MHVTGPQPVLIRVRVRQQPVLLLQVQNPAHALLQIRAQDHQPVHALLPVKAQDPAHALQPVLDQPEDLVIEMFMQHE